VLKPAAVRAGLVSPEETWADPLKPESWVGFHSFRHTCASLLFESGKNVKQVAAWLGHADPGFTLRTYVHLMDEGVGDAAFLDALALCKALCNDPSDEAIRSAAV
jgi:integrase